MTAYTVTSGIPLPSRRAGRKGSKYPFATMKPGDMFYAADGTKPATLRSSVGVFTRSNPGYKFAVRVDDAGRLGCWLTSVAAGSAPVVDTETDEGSASPDANTEQVQGGESNGDTDGEQGNGMPENQ